MIYLDREFEIILLLLQHYVKPTQDPLRIEAAVDWQRLLRIASFHRVVPVICQVLKEVEDVPTDVLQRIRRIVVDQSVMNLRLAAQLKLLLRHFHQRQITVIPFKGCILAAELYDDVAMRSSVDHDMYIPKRQIVESVELFTELGYQCGLLQRLPLRQALSRFHTLEFSHPATRMLIDLHVEPTDGYAPLLTLRDDLTQSTRLFRFEGESIRIFDEDVTAVLVAVHGAKASWACLGAWLDLALFFRRYPQISYVIILTMLRQRGLARMLHVGASLVERCFAVDVPTAIRQGCDHRSIELSRNIVHRLLRDPMNPADGGWAKVLLNLQFRDTWSAKARYLCFKSRSKKVDMAESASRPSVVRHLQRVLRADRDSTVDRA